MYDLFSDSLVCKPCWNKPAFHSCCQTDDAISRPCPLCLVSCYIFMDLCSTYNPGSSLCRHVIRVILFNSPISLSLLISLYLPSFDSTHKPPCSAKGSKACNVNQPPAQRVDPCRRIRGETVIRTNDGVQTIRNKK